MKKANISIVSMITVSILLLVSLTGCSVLTAKPISSFAPVQNTTPPDSGEVLTAIVQAKSVVKPGRNAFVLLPAALNIPSAVNFKFEGRDSFSNTVYVDACRYYFALDDFAALLGGKSSRDSNTYTVTIGTKAYTFDMTKSACAVSDGSSIDLVDIPVEKDGLVYTCMSNLTRVFDLVTSWDLENQTVNFWLDEHPIAQGTQKTLTGGTALIRLEDIYTDGQNNADNALAQARLRAVADLLYGKGIPFQVAWIPRCLIPSENIDNDCETTWSICNCGFVFTLDYLQFRGGSIGLHGYTHADGNNATAAGTDFGKTQNVTASACQAEMDRAKNAAVELKIPYTFFEFPHYAATAKQIKVAEENFNIIYQKYPAKKNQKQLCSVNGTLFVGTPIGYLNNKYELDSFIDTIKSVLTKNELGSFFYHPHIETDWIEVTQAPDIYPSYKYAPGSPLQKILETFEQYNYTFRGISDISSG